MALSLPLHLGEPLITSDGERQPLTGEPSEIVDDIRRYRDVGLEYLVVRNVCKIG